MPRPLRRSLAPVLAALLAVAALPAGTPRSLAAQEAPPSPAHVLGYELGERFTDVEGVNRYFRDLADATDLVSVSEYGRTPEGRPLVQVLVAAPEHRGRLDEVLALNRELTDPATPPERAREIAADNPAVVYFSYGIHGNESSSSEAAMWTAWDLARGAAEVDGVLDSVVVVLDPVVNPDGRDRYVDWYRQARAREPNPDPDSREHREPWPGGRYNHYLFDLNRDWAWLTQPETRARLATWERWNPQVHVDFHEMSRTSTYFFFPPTPPINPIYPDHVLDWGRRFGEANVGAFDERGWLYFTEESYDLFYPGYGDSWPSLLGAVGMTYEQAGGGAAGLVVERPDGTRLTLRDRAQHHRVAGRATLRAAARGRTDLLSGFARTHRRVDEGLSDVVLVPGDDPGRLDALVRLLRDHGIRVERAAEAFSADAEPHPGYGARDRFPAGALRVPVRQSRGRLAAVLLRPDNPFDAEFSYDITAWSLPYAYGVEAHTLTDSPDAGWRPVDVADADADPGGGERPNAAGANAARTATAGYLVRPGFGAAPALVDFLEAGGRARVLPDTFTVGDEGYPRGTILLPRSRNPELDEMLRASGLDSRANPVASIRTDGGADLGTGDALIPRLPRLALLGGRGTRPTSFGAHWSFLERTLKLPFDAVNVDDVAALDLAEYDVVVVPGGDGVIDVLGEAGVEALRSWIRAGGVLVAVDEGARALADPLAGVETGRGSETADDGDGAEDPDPLATRRERRRERWRESMPGAIVAVELDPEHPLTWGAGAADRPERAFVLSGGEVFRPPAGGESPAFFLAEPDAVSGMVTAESLGRLARGAWMVDVPVGEGRVILFADDPLFRLFWYAGFTPYTNAILLGPAR